MHKHRDLSEEGIGPLELGSVQVHVVVSHPMGSGN